MEHTNALRRKQSADRQNVRMMRRTKRRRRGRTWGKVQGEDEGEEANYSPESITPDVNEEIIYLCINTKLFTLSLRLCVYSCAAGQLIAEGGRENLHGKSVLAN